MEMVATGLVAMVLGQRATALQHHVATIHQQAAALAEATIRRPRRSPSHSLLRWSDLSRPPRSLILIEQMEIPGILTSESDSVGDWKKRRIKESPHPGLTSGERGDFVCDDQRGLCDGGDAQSR